MTVRTSKLLPAAFIMLAALMMNCQTAQNSESSDKSSEPTVRETSDEPVKKRDSRGTGCIGGSCDNGTGTFIYESGDRYTGPFENSQREGTGVMEYANGDRYEGEYRADTREGNGTYIFRNKDVYAGRFKDGQREGKGAYTFSATGEVFQGDFQDDGNQANGYVKRDENYYLCNIQGRKLFCNPNPVKSPGELPK